MEHNEELNLAWSFVEKTGCNVFLTGKAGTGKTTFLKELREKSPKRMVVLAPTGIAAINAGGVTIHSFFQLPLSPYIPGATFSTKEQRRYKFGKMKRNIIKTLDLLVIDEISMVRADLLDAIDSVMRRYRVHHLPFGGVQLLLIGDLQQLSPVVKEQEWEMMKPYYDTPYFFSSKALASATYQTIELKRIYRQQDDRFIAILNKIRENKADDTTLALLNERYKPDFSPETGSDYIRLTTHNNLAQSINERKLAELTSKAYTYRAQIEKEFPESSFPADQYLTLKKGAQVMFIKNATDKLYYNGMIGEVVYVDADTVKIMDKANNVEIVLEPAEWTNSKYTIDPDTKEITETVEGVFRQYPLRLAWAITIHKSQGLTFEHAIIDASNSFAHGQTYVALSRCKSLEGMVLNRPLGRSAIICDNTVEAFIKNAEANTPTAETLSDMQREYVVRILNEMFDFTQIRQDVDMIARTLAEHFFNKYHLLLTEYSKAQKQLDAMVDVARKFECQYRGIVMDGTDAGTAMLLERVKRAAGYFANELGTLKELLGKTRIETGNKVVKAQFDDRKSAFAEELMLKDGILNYEADGGVVFSTVGYLKKKAALLLGDDMAEDVGHKGRDVVKLKTAKAAKPPKVPKIPSREISLGMFESGKGVQDIATERQLSPNTVFSHLAYYVEEGRLDLYALVSHEHVEAIGRFLKNCEQPGQMADIKLLQTDGIDYNEVILVKQCMKKEKDK